MDLQKFLFRQRLQTTAILAILKGRQLAIVDKMSELVLQDSTDLCQSQTSSDDELNLIAREASNGNFKKMMHSNNKVDKQLFNQLLIQQYHRTGLPFGTLAEEEELKIERQKTSLTKSKQDQKND